MAWRYLLYRIKAVDDRGVQLPFVIDLLQNVLYVKQDYYAYKPIERLREQLIDTPKSISYIDYGAKGNGKEVTNKLSKIALTALKAPKYGQLLFRLANHFSPNNILELGTSLGLSTAYLAMANKNSKVITMEGAKAIAEVAQKNFKQLKLKNVKQIIGTFDEALTNTLRHVNQLDMVFIDGNHRQDATMRYFNACLNKMHNGTVLIVDDINWSDEMASAWEEIKAHKAVTLTIDLFELGIVFFEKAYTKEHFVIKY